MHVFAKDPSIAILVFILTLNDNKIVFSNVPIAIAYKVLTSISNFHLHFGAFYCMMYVI